MRNYKTVIVLIIFIALSLIGCAQTVRYTQEEIQDYPLAVQEKIMKGEVMLGMTSKQVRYAWGPPNYVRLLDPLDGKQREEWGYTTLGVFEQKRLLFINGRLTYVIPEPQKPAIASESEEPLRDQGSDKSDKKESPKGNEPPAKQDKSKAVEEIRTRELQIK